MKFDVRTNFPEVRRYIGSVGKQAIFATAVALTRTAQDVKAEERKVMPEVFDRPTPYTLNSIFLRPATKERLEAEVWLKDDRAAGGGTPATRYLLPEIEGGARGIKGFERLLIARGYMDANERAVPAAAARIDAYGNMSRGQIVQILSQLRAFRTVGGSSANMTSSRRSQAKRKERRYFVSRGKGVVSRGFGSWWNKGAGKEQHLAKGIWVAEGGRVRPVMLFARRADYRSRYRFFEVAESIVEERFPGHFQDEFSKALRTAR